MIKENIKNHNGVPFPQVSGLFHIIKYSPLWSKGNTPSWLLGEQMCTAMLETSVAVSQRTGNQPTITRPSYTNLRHIPERRSTILQRQLCSQLLYS